MPGLPYAWEARWRLSSQLSRPHFMRIIRRRHNPSAFLQLRSSLGIAGLWLSHCGVGSGGGSGGSGVGDIFPHSLRSKYCDAPPSRASFQLKTVKSHHNPSRLNYLRSRGIPVQSPVTHFQCMHRFYESALTAVSCCTTPPPRKPCSDPPSEPLKDARRNFQRPTHGDTCSNPDRFPCMWGFLQPFTFRWPP